VSDPSDTTHDQVTLRAARARVEALFRRFNRLTPDELGRVGLLRSPEERAALLAAVDTAASEAGRQELVAEAREQARDIVMRRYSDGTFRPTWIALNWGLSGGTVGDRVAVVEALADAAAAAAVADVLDRDAAAALAADAEHVLDLAGGSAFDGALGRALRQPEDPALRRAPRRQRAVLAVVAVIVVLISLAGLAVGTVQGVIGSLLAVVIAVGFVYWLLARSSDRP